MKVPLPWLREYCDPDLDVRAIEERLTMTGTKVEAIHHHGVPATDGFVVGRVLSAEQHPDADRLKVCAVQLDGDGGEPSPSSAGPPTSPPDRRSRLHARGRSCPMGPSCAGQSSAGSPPRG